MEDEKKPEEKFTNETMVRLTPRGAMYAVFLEAGIGDKFEEIIGNKMFVEAFINQLVWLGFINPESFNPEFVKKRE